MQKSVELIAFTFLIAYANCIVNKKEFVHHVFLDTQGKFLLKWTPYNEKIIFEVEVEALGYAGLGFSHDGGMKGSDIVLGWVDESGIVKLSDRHAIGNQMPIEDKSQDYTLLGGRKNGSHTTIMFSRLWETCDDDDKTLTEDTVRVIWAYSSASPKEQNEDAIFPYHPERGTKSVYFLNNQEVNSPTHPDVKYWDITNPNVSIPGDEKTIYWCSISRIPKLYKKHHAIGFKPVIEQKNQRFVHHIDLYECHSKDQVKLEEYLDHPGTECFAANMPLEWLDCQALNYAWAIGSQGEMFPENVGQPIGGENSVEYMLMQTHYDNPTLQKGIVDNSGLRIYYTSKLRTFDAGMLSIGEGVKNIHFIPPHQKHWTTMSYCPAACLAQGIPKTGIRAFSAVLHAHLLGREIYVHIFRNGKEIPILAQDNSYDFNYQQTRMFQEEKVILPTDHIVTKCVYDSTQRNNITWGGYRTEDEMCLAFIMYYPLQSVFQCNSNPSSKLFEDFLNLTNSNNSNSRKMYSNNSVTEESNAPLIQKKLVPYGPSGLSDRNFALKIEEINLKSPEKLVALQQHSFDNHNPYDIKCGLKIGATTKEISAEMKMPHLIPLTETKKKICVIASTQNNFKSKYSFMTSVATKKIFFHGPIVSVLFIAVLKVISFMVSTN